MPATSASEDPGRAHAAMINVVAVWQCRAADTAYPVRRQATPLEGSEEDVRQPQKVRHAGVEGLSEYAHRPRGGVFPSKLDVASSSLVSRCPDPTPNSFRIRNIGCGRPPGGGNDGAGKGVRKDAKKVLDALIETFASRSSSCPRNRSGAAPAPATPRPPRLPSNPGSSPTGRAATPPLRRGGMSCGQKLCIASYEQVHCLCSREKEKVDW
jgi:hypothetical protein